jgi:protocatechuate 3,4-dioxygenase beta subunit
MTSIDMRDEPDNVDVSRVLLNRRRLLALGGAGAAAAGLAAVGGRAAFAGDTAPAVTGQPVSVAEAAAACSLTSESIEGPYYLDYLLMRRNVVEDRTGVRLNLRLRVIDSASCRPIRNAGVEIWHCDALGVYSGYTATGSGGGGTPPSGPPPSGPPPGGGGGGGGHATPTDDLTYLRGIQVSDHNGYVTFASIVPGWYAGRAVHIHTKVHTDGTAAKDGYSGGHTCHTGQLYFQEALISRLTTVAPYSTDTASRTTLDADSLYDGTGATGGLLALRYDPRHIERGVQATLTMSVDPAATNDGEDSGPGGGPPPTAGPSASA